MPVRPLPSNANLQHLKYQAKDLLHDRLARDPAAAQRIREFHPRFAESSDHEIYATAFRLSDAQLTIARESGFPSWTRLKRHIEKPTLADHLELPHHQRIENEEFRRAVEMLDTGDASRLREHLRRHPNLSRQRLLFEGGNYFRKPTLLEFAAENPFRRGKLPKNIVEMAGIILDAGAEPSALNETLSLVATGRVPRECGVQIPLIDLLCDRGADPNSAAEAAALHGEFEGLQALIRRGARINLPVSAALGELDQFERLLAGATARDRHLAVALAAQWNRLEIMRMLLDAGEDPSRYNPVGGHSHSTPLHQAAGAGYGEVVRLLLERGARTDLKDVLWHATPAGWAHHAGHEEIEEFLLKRERKQC